MSMSTLRAFYEQEPSYTRILHYMALFPKKHELQFIQGEPDFFRTGKSVRYTVDEALLAEANAAIVEQGEQAVPFVKHVLRYLFRHTLYEPRVQHAYEPLLPAVLLDDATCQALLTYLIKQGELQYVLQLMDALLLCVKLLTTQPLQMHIDASEYETRFELEGPTFTDLLCSLHDAFEWMLPYIAQLPAYEQLRYLQSQLRALHIYAEPEPSIGHALYLRLFEPFLALEVAEKATYFNDYAANMYTPANVESTVHGGQDVIETITVNGDEVIVVTHRFGGLQQSTISRIVVQLATPHDTLVRHVLATIGRQSLQLDISTDVIDAVIARAGEPVMLGEAIAATYAQHSLVIAPPVTKDILVEALPEGL